MFAVMTSHFIYCPIICGLYLIIFCLVSSCKLNVLSHYFISVLPRVLVCIKTYLGNKPDSDPNKTSEQQYIESKYCCNKCLTHLQQVLTRMLCNNIFFYSKPCCCEQVCVFFVQLFFKSSHPLDNACISFVREWDFPWIYFLSSQEALMVSWICFNVC